MAERMQVFMEYKILAGNERAYEAWMKQVPKELVRYGARDFSWFEAWDQPGLYVELFTVPSLETYEQIKDLRRTKDHPVFGDLAKWMHKPLEEVNCWAFRDRTEKEDSET
ncbi:MFS transporter [Natribacillus halophilus]|nr:MFS transporter [Natribacillus halophilus]